MMKLLIAELKNPVIYISSLLMWLLISFLTAQFSVYSFIVPFFVQMITRCVITLKNEKMNFLLQLPAEKDDPVFIANKKMEIVLSTGKTERLFKEKRIKKLSDLIDTEGIQNMLKKENCDTNEYDMTDVYSKVMNKYYRIKMKHTLNSTGKEADYCLVWFQDITMEKDFEERHNELLALSNDYLKSTTTWSYETENNEERLAKFVLENGFEAVFVIEKKQDQHGFQGKVYLFNGELRTSGIIDISSEADLPVLLSKGSADVTAFSEEEYPDFEEKFNFHEDVKAFIGKRIRNFITYHEMDLYVIAFNYQHQLTKYVKSFFKTYVNFYKVIKTLSELIKENDEQFLQKIFGLSAAAEYSDEITGDHILRVNDYSLFIAEKLNMDPEFCRNISQIAAIHDIGKVAIPELIKLERVYTDDERKQMQMHTVYGAQIIKTMMEYSSKRDKRLEMAYNIALHHHQIYIGGGYPGLKMADNVIDPDSKDYKDYLEYDGLKGEEIPIEARIVALADRYDALRSPRQYKPQFSHEKTCAILETDDRLNITGEEWFGKQVWDVFVQNKAEFDKIYSSKNINPIKKAVGAN